MPSIIDFTGFYTLIENWCMSTKEKKIVSLATEMLNVFYRDTLDTISKARYLDKLKQGRCRKALWVIGYIGKLSIV
jgi:hypothetical protein